MFLIIFKIIKSPKYLEAAFRFTDAIKELKNETNKNKTFREK